MDEQRMSRVSSCVAIEWRAIRVGGSVGTLRPAMSGRGVVDEKVESRQRDGGKEEGGGSERVGKKQGYG